MSMGPAELLIIALIGILQFLLLAYLVFLFVRRWLRRDAQRLQANPPIASLRAKRTHTTRHLGIVFNMALVSVGVAVFYFAWQTQPGPGNPSLAQQKAVMLGVGIFLGCLGLIGVTRSLRNVRASSEDSDVPVATGGFVQEQQPDVVQHQLGFVSPELPRASPARTAVPETKFTYATGDRPLDGYTIKRGIGRGGFGEVYYAVSDGGKEVALKLVQRHLDVELRGVGQCLNLKHPNLVTIYDVKQAANGDYWVVMEYLSGAVLSDVLAANPNGLTHDQINAWLRGICDGVGNLHEHGIVHRDLKPGNIFVEHGVVKIGDYGLAKYISASRRSGQTESVGTVHYMAPEVSRGRYGKEIDLYALGVILFEMLTGRVPFSGESPGEILMRHLTEQPDTSSLPEPFRPVVARLLAKDPADRYPSVAAMLAELSGAAPPVPPVAIASPPRHVEIARTGSWHGDFVHQPAALRTRRYSAATVIGSCIGFVAMLGFLFMIIWSARQHTGRSAGSPVPPTRSGDWQEPSLVEEWRRFATHTGGFVGLAFHPDNKRLASVYRDGALLVHDIEKPEWLLALTGIGAASFTPDGTGIIVSDTVGREFGSARIVDAGTGETKVRLEGEIGPLTQFAFAPGGNRVAALNDNGRLVRTWNTDTGSQESMFGKELAEPAIIGIAFRDVRNLLAVDERLQAWLWDSAPGNSKPTQLETAQGIVQGGFTATSVVFSRNAESYAAGLDVGRVYYRTVGGLPTALIHAHSGPVQSVAVSGQRNWLASSGADGMTRVYTIGSSPSPYARISGTERFSAIALSEDGRLLAAGDANGTVVVYKILLKHEAIAPVAAGRPRQEGASAEEDKALSKAKAGTAGIYLGTVASIGALMVVTGLLIYVILIRRPRRALYRAAKAGDISCVRLLLADGADVNARRSGNRTALIAAAEAGHLAVVQHLLERGADPNARLSNGETALSLATVAGHAAVVDSLIAAGADVNSRASDGDTPLIEAAYAGHVAILRTLLEHGADMTTRSGSDGSTPLIWAAYAGHSACVEALLEHGANVNEKDTGDGSTPLIWAAYEGHPNVVRVLLDHGADPNETNSSGETAMDHAESEEIGSLLGGAMVKK